jgi:hypothetical protein
LKGGENKRKEKIREKREKGGKNERGGEKRIVYSSL